MTKKNRFRHGFQRRETKFVVVVLHGNMNKPATGLLLFSFFRASVKVKVAESLKIVNYALRTKGIGKKNTSPNFFSHYHEEQPCQILFSQLSKTMAQSFEDKMFRLSLDPFTTRDSV